MLFKSKFLHYKGVDENVWMFKEKVKTVFKWCFLAISVLFVLLLYIPQVTISKKSTVIVDGWGVNTSRSISLYVLPQNETALISDNQLCSEPLLLLIVVCSAVNNSAERATIRETWGNFSSPSYKLSFLLGTTENTTLQENVEEEASIHNDIIQENFIDSYNNLTLKSVMLLKYVTSHCDKVEFILKSDDDMFVHVQNLVNLVQSFHEKNIKNVLVGELICDAKPILDTSSKWYSPKYMYEGRVYPHYLSGTGYLMDRNTALLLYDAALTTPFFHLEDVYITGLCARRANIKPRHNAGFSYLTRPLDPCLYIKNPNIITSHRVTLDNMKQLWSGLQNRTLCPEPASGAKAKPARKLLKVKKNNRCS